MAWKRSGVQFPLAPLSQAVPHGPALSHRGRAVRLVLAATFLYASVPPILHLAASDTNPFYFNFMITIMQVSIPGLFLVWSKDSYVNRYLSAAQRRSLKRPRVHFTYFRRTSGPTGNKAVVLKGIRSQRCSRLGQDAHRLGADLSLHYGFLAWSATILETAIATTIFELWPVFLVYALARHEDSDRLFRGLASIGYARRAISKEGMVLTALAGSGLALMLGSQAGGQIRSVVDLVSYKVAAGMIIAVVASLLAALSVLSNLAYGRSSTTRWCPPEEPSHPAGTGVSRRGPSSSEEILIAGCLSG